MTHYITIIMQLIFFSLSVRFNPVGGLFPTPWMKSLAGHSWITHTKKNYENPIFIQLNFSFPSTCYIFRSQACTRNCGVVAFFLRSCSSVALMLLAHSLSVFFWSSVGCQTPPAAASTPSAGGNSSPHFCIPGHHSRFFWKSCLTLAEACLGKLSFQMTPGHLTPHDLVSIFLEVFSFGFLSVGVQLLAQYSAATLPPLCRNPH